MTDISKSETDHESTGAEDSMNSCADVWLGALSHASLMCFVGFVASIIFDDAGLLLWVALGAAAGSIASVFLLPDGCRHTGIRVRRLLCRDQGSLRQAVALGRAEEKLNTSVNSSDVQASSTTSSHDDPDIIDNIIVERPDLDLFEFYDLSGEHTQDTNASSKNTKLAREAH